MKKRIIDAVLKHKIIAILRGVPKDKIIPLADALYDGGIRLIEVPFDMKKKVSDEETCEMISMLVNRFQDKMFVGTGTVLTPIQVEMTKKAGGNYIISPDTSEEVIKKTVQLGMVSMPGALTPSEITAAVKYGADFVKVFPVGNFGPSYIKAVRAPLSNVKMLAVGGINEKNIKEYLDVGICGFGIGSNIVDKKMLENDDYEGITNLTKKFFDSLGE